MLKPMTEGEREAVVLTAAGTVSLGILGLSAGAAFGFSPSGAILEFLLQWVSVLVPLAIVPILAADYMCERNDIGSLTGHVLAGLGVSLIVLLIVGASASLFGLKLFNQTFAIGAGLSGCMGVFIHQFFGEQSLTKNGVN